MQQNPVTPPQPAHPPVDLTHLVVRIGAALTHEFNHLLMVVEANLGMARKRAGAADPALGATIGRALRAAEAAEAAAALTRHLSALANWPSERREPVHLNGLARHAVRVLRPILPSSIRLEFAGATPLWRAQGDRFRIEAIILDLLLKARDTLADGGTIRIRTANRTIRGARGTKGPLPGDYVALELARGRAGPGLGLPSDLTNAILFVRPAGGRVSQARGRHGSTRVTLLLPRGQPRAIGRPRLARHGLHQRG
ncbi:MAG: hypothetical protein EXQ87_00595 [Alphaproteobacteria bacterium]|nr:hypothetical protein [Alphaproteobacteria bacterium]